MSPLPPRSFSGKTQRQLDLWRKPSQPAPLKETLFDGNEVERLAGKARVDRIVRDTNAGLPTQPVNIEVNGETIDLADPLRFPNASHDRTAWLKDIQSKIPPGEKETEQIRLIGGEAFGLFDESGEQKMWEDGRKWR